MKNATPNMINVVEAEGIAVKLYQGTNGHFYVAVFDVEEGEAYQITHYAALETAEAAFAKIVAPPEPGAMISFPIFHSPVSK